MCDSCKAHGPLSPETLVCRASPDQLMRLLILNSAAAPTGAQGDGRYDAAHTAEVIEPADCRGRRRPAISGWRRHGLPCGRRDGRLPRAAGKSEILDRYAKDYPQGPA
jgi:hypothetical protein